jgi:hypothetical protein
LRVSNKEVTSPIFKYIDFVVYSLVLKVLNKSVVCREPMPLLPFERGIQVIYIVTAGPWVIREELLQRQELNWIVFGPRATLGIEKKRQRRKEDEADVPRA